MLGPTTIAPQASLWHSSAPAGSGREAERSCETASHVDRICQQSEGAEESGNVTCHACNSLSDIITPVIIQECRQSAATDRLSGKTQLIIGSVRTSTWQKMQTSKATVPRLPKIHGIEARR